MSATFNEQVASLGLVLTEPQMAQIEHYLALLMKWNKVYNLTAIRDEAQARVLHLLDCLALVPHLPAGSSSLLDVGTGAGLPAVMIAIARPDIQVTALDAVQKKISFVRQVATECGLKNLLASHRRIEDETTQYDLITSRAFASLADFVTLAAPHLKPGGQLLAMKALAVETLNLPGWQSVVLPLQVPDLAAARHVLRLTRL
jgi:16S rRNA (guanine527-N7)-methyltransferase